MSAEEKKQLELFRERVGKNKIIPKKYEKSILAALVHYPELKDITIHFRIKEHHILPYNTKPALGYLLQKPSDRKYVITICETAEHPTYLALFKNLPLQARVGVIGHELAHVVQYHACGRSKLLHLLLQRMQPAAQRRMEREADKIAIDHGLGMELYAYASFIHSIPGYAKEHEIDGNYLTPAEILDALSIPH